jgi:transposase
MSGPEMLLNCFGLRVTNLDVTERVVTVHVESTVAGANCPHCGSAAARVHSRYPRTVTDQPIHGRRTVL